MKILFIGCHCDDIELGCGGTLYQLSKKHEVKCLVLSSTGRGQFPELHSDSTRALKLLGATNISFRQHMPSSFPEQRQSVWEALHYVQLEFEPDVVFTQEPDDHQDHVVLAEETIRNFRRSSIIQYTVMRSCMGFVPNFFVRLTREEVDAKIAALSHYSMYTKSKNYFRAENIEAQIRASGVYVEEEFVEAFKIVKMFSHHNLI